MAEQSTGELSPKNEWFKGLSHQAATTIAEDLGFGVEMDPFSPTRSDLQHRQSYSKVTRYWSQGYPTPLDSELDEANSLINLQKEKLKIGQVKRLEELERRRKNYFGEEHSEEILSLREKLKTRVREPKEKAG